MPEVIKKLDKRSDSDKAKLTIQVRVIFIYYFLNWTKVSHISCLNSKVAPDIGHSQHLITSFMAQLLHPAVSILSFFLHTCFSFSQTGMLESAQCFKLSQIWPVLRRIRLISAVVALSNTSHNWLQVVFTICFYMLNCNCQVNLFTFVLRTLPVMSVPSSCLHGCCYTTDLEVTGSTLFPSTFLDHFELAHNKVEMASI